MKVGIVMGSESDWPVMKEAALILTEFGIETDCRVLSAHRTPHELETWVKDSLDKDIRIFIAGAGGAAHLAGVVASFTVLPVIGVPIKSRSFDGLDSLLSTVQMPPGVPVATVGVNGAKNAGLLALQIMAISDDGIKEKLTAYRKKQVEKIITTTLSLQG